MPFARDGSMMMHSLQTSENAGAAVSMAAVVGAGLRPRLSALRRVVEYAVLAVVWIGVGLILSVGLVPFLLIGAALLVLFQLARRKPLRALWARDTDSFARGWAGKSLVAAVLLVIPTVMLLQSVRMDRYENDSWTALVMAAVLACSYVISRRLVLTVAAAALAVLVTSWMLTPNLATDGNGDPTVLAHLEKQREIGKLDGFQDIAVAEIDLDAPDRVRLAGLGATATTPMEVGSVTKAMTGLVIADAVGRGEVRIDVPVSDYLPQLSGSPAGTVTLHELVTHTAGYADFGGVTLRRGFWSAPLGRSFLATTAEQMTQDVRGQNLGSRGLWKYSNLGAATAGQAVAAAAGMSYSDLMRTRLLETLGKSQTDIQTDEALVAGGKSQTGLPVQPWTFDAYAPAGAVVSTTADLAKLATALLDGTAPGMSALDGATPTLQADTLIGDFWAVSTRPNGQIVTWHSGRTGGYASYFGVDRAHRKAVVVLSDVATAATNDLGIDLLDMNG
jgi:CubicO group peptidase (beta-lactamase class C family)